MTPILSKLREYINSKPVRFHMPGHKGVLPSPFDSLAPLDVTELPATDDLYSSTGAIAESERLFAALYGAAGCHYLTGGSTQGIFAMLAAHTEPRSVITTDRMCHKSVYHAMAVLDLYPEYVFREIHPERGVPLGFKPGEYSGKTAIFTSPNYYGVMVNAPGMAERTICDAAHGAHLPFVTDNYKPPANVYVVSAHKTLAALGQTAMVLFDPLTDAERLREFEAVFGTSSPSFALLCSLDAERERLTETGKQDWKRVLRAAHELRDGDDGFLSESGIQGLRLDPARLCLRTGDGFAAAEQLRRDFNIECEMSDRENVVFLLSPSNMDEDFERLAAAVKAVPRMKTQKLPDFPAPVIAATPREALFSKTRLVELNRSAGKIAAQCVAPYPPGVPVIAPGEKIDKKHLEILSMMCYNDNRYIRILL